MGSKSKRRHAQKQYNRAAQNKPTVSATADTTVENDDKVVANSSATTPIVMTPKEFRQAEKERAKQKKLIRKAKAKTATEKNKNKEKKPFFLVRFFKWLWRSIISVFSELKKVHWPTAKQVLKATGIVLGIVVLFGVILLVVWILFGLLHYLLVNGSLSGWTVF
ncbi:MAG: preprotein translocase subunit SecE [Clostridia bacterium]|nr:preprotein translocase subunit SecE [Clostridia bacterium]